MINKKRYKQVYPMWVSNFDTLNDWPILFKPTNLITSHKIKFIKHNASYLGNKSINKSEGNAIYIHIPFCDSICAFCCFSRVLKNELLVKGYLEALKSEIVLYAKTPYIKSTKFNAIYFGGGTPTCLATNQLVDLLTFCKNNFNIFPDAEITIEGSPSNADEEKLVTLRESGVNRLSFGVQTFNKRIGRFLDLPQSPSLSQKRIKMARQIGYDNVDIDLLYNLPGQSMDDWTEDLRIAIGLNPEQICFCQVSVFNSSNLAKKLALGQIPPLAGQNTGINMYMKALKMISKAGYRQNFLATFCRPGKSCKYNEMNINGTYNVLALGLSSQGYINNIIYHNVSSLNEYIELAEAKQFPSHFAAKVPQYEEMRLFMMKGLRLLRIDKEVFCRRYGKYPEDVFPETIGSLVKRGLIEVNKREVKLTALGVIWGNNVRCEFLSPADKIRLEIEEGNYLKFSKFLRI